MIEIKNVTKSFNERTIINDINAVFDTGKCNLIIGASGSGKSVLIKSMVDIFPPNTGSILYDGINITTADVETKKELRQQIGMLFQSSALFDSMTVEQNILFSLDFFTRMSQSEKKKRVDEVLARVDLKDAHKKYPSEISGGMKKRVGIARAIVLNPKYLFCDEPNSGLDPQTSIVIDELIMEITEEYKITTITNTHDMNSVITNGDKILFLHEGNKHWEGTKHSLFETDNKELINFIFASDFLKEARDVRHQKIIEDLSKISK